MKLYISDLHFGHERVIQFDHRPFADRDEMDRVMMERWNLRVEADDDVYVAGDFCLKCDRTPDWYLSRLKGHKHLVVGNHDKVASACINNYTPASFSELLLKNKAFQERT